MGFIVAKLPKVEKNACNSIKETDCFIEAELCRLDLQAAFAHDPYL